MILIIFKKIFFSKNLFSFHNRMKSSRKKNLKIRWFRKTSKNQSFNGKIQEVNKVERKSIANNLVQIFEGETFAYTKGDISPFIPFSRVSNGHINSLFYNDLDRGEGEGKKADIFFIVDIQNFS